MADEQNPSPNEKRRPPPLPRETILALMEDFDDPEWREGWRDFLDGRWYTSEVFMAEVDRIVEEVTADPRPIIVDDRP